MATHSGLFTFEDARATLTQGVDGVWLGETRTPAPARTASGLTATFDGRLDNRETLLRLPGMAALGGSADAPLVLAVFEQWRGDGLRRLVGDWALAVWDASARTLHLARDYMGARPLYYRVDGRCVAWSSDLAALAARIERADALSERFAAAFMGLALSPEITPYDAVFAVPPGVCVSISDSGAVTRCRFWTIDVGEIRYPDPRAYEEQLYSLWSEAVRTRLRTGAAVWAELSGGLDSSSVACMADLLIRRGEAAAPALHLISHATLHSPEGDERRFIADVERAVGTTSEIVGVEDSQERLDPTRAWVTPYALHGVGLETVCRIESAGGRVVLSGRLGDAIMGCQPDNSRAVFDDLARGAVLTALANLRAWSRATRTPFLELALKLTAADVHRPADAGIDLLTAPLQTMVRDLPRMQVPHGIRRSKRALARMVLGYSATARLDVPDRPPASVYAYPFSHRPLVEFMLAIPGDQVSAPGTTRALMRRAFASFVPPRVLRRVSKGYYPPAAFRAVRAAVASMPPLADLEVVQRGWIDRDRLRAAIQALTDGGGNTGGEIGAVLRLERWLQLRRQRFDIPSRKEVNSHAVLHA
jgi:asparagine synthase (glutamine-hydrolysing)